VSRTAKIERATKETSIVVELNLDGAGVGNISTGIPFYDHMLDQIARHGGFDLTVKAVGDLHIDTHHTVEDVAIAVGEAFRQAAGDRAGVRRTHSMKHWWLLLSTCRAAHSFTGKCHFLSRYHLVNQHSTRNSPNTPFLHLPHRQISHCM
jgi:imidazoleglycerol phosphate dehydratase HisB